MNRARAVRYDNGDMEKEIAEFDISRSHQVYSGKNGYRSRAVSFAEGYGNRVKTENGGLGHRTTGHELLDLHFQVSSLRRQNVRYIEDNFVKAYYENRRYAVKWLFYLRDIGQGLGERRSFRICMRYLAQSHPKIAREVMELIPRYGRYDDLMLYLDTPLQEEMGAFVAGQLKADREAMKAGRPASLLAKWLPSINTSSASTRAMAVRVSGMLGMDRREYRRTLSALRAYLNVTEVKMSAGQWEQVDYEKVPAKANLRYDAAFARHDRGRREDYLRRVYLEDGKLNIGGIMPYEIVHKIYCGSNSWCWDASLKENLLAELMWQKLLREGFENEWGLEDCIVVADGSGSMYSLVDGSGLVSAIEVCHSLAIYFAAQLKGIFHDMAISFSETPRLIDLSRGESLKEKLEIMRAYDEVANTNIQAVFRLLLDMAVSGEVPAEQIPGQVLIISDMEFDAATGGRYGRIFDRTVFDCIAGEYARAGYVMPRLIFWNVCGRSNAIPMVKGEQGVCLLSGFSQNAIREAAHREIQDPYESLCRTLDGPRYAPVEEALQRAAV